MGLQLPPRRLRRKPNRSSMPQKNYTHISILLDRSGSMNDAGKREEAISGFNNFIAEQKKIPGKVTISLAQFDHQYEVLHDFLKLEYVPALTKEKYVPRGMTALLDAFGRLMTTTGSTLASMPEAERPSKVLFVVITDGQENSSKEMTSARIAEMVDEQRNKYSWAFIYLGADLKDFDGSGMLGVGGLTNYQFTNGYDGLMNAHTFSVSTASGVRHANAFACAAAAVYRTTGSVSLGDTEE